MSVFSVSVDSSERVSSVFIISGSSLLFFFGSALAGRLAQVGVVWRMYRGLAEEALAEEETRPEGREGKRGFLRTGQGERLQQEALREYQEEALREFQVERGATLIFLPLQFRHRRGEDESGVPTGSYLVSAISVSAISIVS